MVVFFTDKLWKQASDRLDQESQHVLVFALFRYMTNGSTKVAVTRADFRRTFSGRPTITSSLCPNGHELESQPALCCPATYFCDDCKQECALNFLSCERCDFDLCRDCIQKRKQQNKDTILLASRKRDKLRAQWNNVRFFVEVLSESLADLDDLFTTPQGRIEIIDRADFVAAVHELFPGDAEAPGALFDTVALYLEAQDAGMGARHNSATRGLIKERATLTFEELHACMQVVDSTSRA